MTVEEALAIWLSRNSECRDPALIENPHFMAEEGYAYSDHTEVGPKAMIEFRYGGLYKSVEVESTKVTEFINGVFHIMNESPEKAQ